MKKYVPVKQKGAVELITVTLGVVFSPFVEEEEDDCRNHEYRCGDIVVSQYLCQFIFYCFPVIAKCVPRLNPYQVPH